MTADVASVRIGAPAEQVFEFMADLEKLTLWSFGTWRTEIGSDGLVQGWSLATGAPIWLRIEAHRETLLIDYHLGASADALLPRISARVIPGAVTGHDTDSATLLMIALRTAGMDDARWGGLVRAHAAEVDIIKGLIESGHDHRTGA